MPNYIVKTTRDRNLVIEADYYRYNAAEEVYEFFKNDQSPACGYANSGGHSNLARSSASGSQKIATVPRSPELLAIVTNESEQADFYYVEDLNEEDEEDIEDEDECDDTCLDCRLEEFTQSDTFFDEVYSIIDFYHSEDNQEPAECSEPHLEYYPIEHWKDKSGTEWWGFHTDKGFVHCCSEDFALTCRQVQIDNPSEDWSYLDLTGATRLED